MNIKNLPLTKNLTYHLIDKYGLDYTQALELICDLNCEDIDGFKTPFGQKTVELFSKSSDEIQMKSIEEF